MSSVRKTEQDVGRELNDGSLTEKSRFRISPIKMRESMLTRKPLKPFSSSIIQDRKPNLTRKDIFKINSKIELIKSKVMKNKGAIPRSASRRTMESQLFGENDNDV